MVEKNPADMMLLDHAAGTLPPSLDVMMASYVALNQDARASVEALTAVGGALLEDEDATTEIASDAFDLVMSRINDGDAPAETQPLSPVDAHTQAVVPLPLRRLLPGSLDSLKWKSRGGGVREYHLDTGSDGLKASLLWIAPGRSVPQHTHRGREYTLVLEGAYTDQKETVAAGDFVVNDSTDAHSPVADSALGCLCFAVTDAPLKFHGPLGWILNPFMRY